MKLYLILIDKGEDSPRKNSLSFPRLSSQTFHAILFLQTQLGPYLNSLASLVVVVVVRREKLYTRCSETHEVAPVTPRNLVDRA